MTPGFLTCDISQTPRWSRFLAGLAIDAVGLLLLVFSGAHLSVVPLPPVMTRHYVTLVAPITAPVKIEPVSTPATQLPVRVAKLESPKPVPAPVHTQPSPPARVQTPKSEPPKVVASAPPAPKPLVRPQIKTNVFASEPSDTATVRQPARKVQTGGFGDPKGVPLQTPTNANAVTLAKLGSFDLPAGPGRGNGMAGARGVTGTIHSTGFDEPVASNASQVRNDRALAPSGFIGVAVQAKVSEPRQAQKKAVLQPVEIIYKPRPAYTAEARRLRVEGEVLLDVVFTASGSLRVNRVVKGLGYGLDDRARAAARQIQFHPARCDGQPCDYAALVHIVFELSE